MEIRYIQLSGVADSSVANYEARIKKLIEITGNKPLKHILKHPDEIYPIIVQHTQGKCTTIANFATAVCKIFSSNPEIAQRYPKANKRWKHYLYKCRKEQNDVYSENKAPAEKLKDIITMEDLRAKYQEMSRLMKTRKEALDFTLLSCFIHLVPKRADLGNVVIYTSSPVPPPPPHTNYMVLTPEKPFLQLNKFKTAKHMAQGITEQLPQQLRTDILRSLEVFPRQHLLTNTKGEPYIINNSYTQFVKRTFQRLFGKGMGVSLWRHIYVSTEMDLHRMSDKEIQDRVTKMGTSERQLKHVYKWINIEHQKDRVCETVCRPATMQKK